MANQYIFTLKMATAMFVCLFVWQTVTGWFQFMLLSCYRRKQQSRYLRHSPPPKFLLMA
jgi:hypothetical protein